MQHITEMITSFVLIFQQLLQCFTQDLLVVFTLALEGDCSEHAGGNPSTITGTAVVRELNSRCRPSPVYSPLKRGVRFSLKAARPSSRSFVGITLEKNNSNIDGGVHNDKPFKI